MTDRRMQAMPPVLKFEIESMRATVLQALTDYGETWREVTKQAVESFDWKAAIEAQVGPLIHEAIRAEVQRQVQWQARHIVEAAVGRHRLARALERIERAVLKDIQIRMAEEGIE